MKTLIYFGAPWCQTCKDLEPVVADVVLETGVNFLKYDLEESPKIAKRYNINVIPCIIILEDDVEVKKSVGKKSKEKILDLLL